VDSTIGVTFRIVALFLNLNHEMGATSPACCRRTDCHDVVLDRFLTLKEMSGFAYGYAVTIIVSAGG